MKKYKTIKEIITQCEVDIEEDIKCLEFIKCIDFIDIFPISDEHKALLDKEALGIATIIDKTERGNFYVFNEPIATRFGQIKICKIRKFDETRLNWVAAPDFATTNYDKFLELLMSKYQDITNVQIFRRKGMSVREKWNQDLY